MTDKFTITDFNKRFPDDDTCLEELKATRFPDGLVCPKCDRDTRFYRVKGRTAYACNWCGFHVYPLAGTIFEKSTTPLKLWFYAMYLIVQTRAGVSAKTLQRELGVTYKTAWRMFKQIRMLMSDDDLVFEGLVEVDEAYMGGKGYNRKTKHDSQFNKSIVFGMVEREGKAYLRHVPNTGKWTLIKQINQHVDSKATIFHDEMRAYKNLHKEGYTHFGVNHGKMQFRKGQAHTQNIENVWSHLKRGVYGVYRKVSVKYLQAYVDEYAWRYNHRKLNGLMFDALLSQVSAVRAVKRV